MLPLANYEREGSAVSYIAPKDNQGGNSKDCHTWRFFEFMLQYPQYEEE